MIRNVKQLGVWTLVGTLSAFLAACGAANKAGQSDDQEMGNAAGDAMASLDESSAGSGFADNRSFPLRKEPEFLKPGAGQKALDAMYSRAWAAGCWQESFKTCDAGVRTHAFADCTFGGSTLDGTVTLSFSDQSCSLADAGDAVTRNANFTLTGPAGGTYTVTTPNGGQKLTRTANGFTYSVDGIQRVAQKNGKTLFDFTVKTTSDLAVTGIQRAGRVANGGVLVITNNLKGYSAALTPNNVTWSGSCNCPLSGTVTGTFSGSKSGDATLTFNGCGTGTLEYNGNTTQLDFDRCGAT